jgi:hypothetical protein
MQLPDEPDRSVLAKLLKADFKPRVGETVAKVEKAVGRPGLEPVLRRLLERGFVVAGKKPGTFTASPEAALALKAEAEAKKPKKTPSVRGSAAALAAMEARLLDAILPRLERIERSLGSGPQTLPARETQAARPSPNGAALTDVQVQEALREVDASGRHGGLVPIPALRRAVLERTGAAREAFDARLLEMEKRFALDLKISDNPRIAGAEEGIAVPGRGLVFYAVVR